MEIKKGKGSGFMILKNTNAAAGNQIDYTEKDFLGTEQSLPYSISQ